MWLTRLFKKKQADTLPPEVAAAVDGCWVVDRSGGDDDGDVRIFFALSGRQLAPLDRAEKVLQKTFPELTPGQLVRAVAMLHSQVRIAMREQAFSGDQGPRSSRRIDNSRSKSSWLNSYRF